MVHLPGGRIAYHATKNGFEAICGNKSHKGCSLSRTAKGRKAKGSDLQVGWEASWVSGEVATGSQCGGEQGGSTRTLRGLWPTLMLRDWLVGGEVARCPGGAELLDMERERQEGEGSEPEDLGPYF